MLVLTTNGIITDDLNRVLLVQRSDSRTLAPPGGTLEFGELPPQSAAREVLEETGLTVRPTQLAAVYYWPARPLQFLTFSFRCERENGRLTPSVETPRLGYFNTTPLPWRLLPFHRKRVAAGLAYTAGPPTWTYQQTNPIESAGKLFLERVVYPFWRWQFRRRGLNYQIRPNFSWKIGAFVVVRNEAGAVLWVKRTDADVWNLPGGGAGTIEAPWETAVRETHEETGLHVQLTDLSGVYTYHDIPHVIFTFTADVIAGALTTGPEAAAFAWFQPGAEPDNVVPQHVERAADACAPRETTHFRFQPS